MTQPTWSAIRRWYVSLAVDVPSPEPLPATGRAVGYLLAELSLGIRTVSQIASLDAGEIERVALGIKARPDRILRDDWVGQAKRLLGNEPAIGDDGQIRG